MYNGRQQNIETIVLYSEKVIQFHILGTSLPVFQNVDLAILDIDHSIMVLYLLQMYICIFFLPATKQDLKFSLSSNHKGSRDSQHKVGYRMLFSDA